MRNDTARWDPPVPLSFTSDRLTISEVTLPRQIWVSGIDVLEQFADQLIAWPDIATSDRYVVALRRDRVLLVGPTGHPPGYSPETGLATTEVSDAYLVIDISGPDALKALRRGTELRLDQPSRSVLRRLFSIEAMLYRVTDEGTFRAHIPRAMAQAFFSHLTA